MALNPDIKNIEVMRAVIRSKFPLFRFARILKNLFLALFLISFLLTGFSFFNITSGYITTKLAVAFLSLYLIFWEINLFSELKIKRPNISPNFLDAASNPDGYNLLRFLDLNSAAIVMKMMKFCKKKKLPVGSTVLLYWLARLGRDIPLIFARLGLSQKRIQSDIRNYLEKIPKQIEPGFFFLDDFQKMMGRALQLAVEWGRESIGEMELLAAAAQEDDFFKKILIEFDLKPEDVENITRWLDLAEASIEKNKKFWSYENLLRSGSLGKDWSSGYTLTLDKFSIDWRKVVSKWKFREIIGHQKEIEEVELILSKPGADNVMIVGNPGTGRKSIIQALAQKCYLGTSLPQLNSKRVVELDLVLLAARIPDFETLESALDQIFSEVAASGSVILVIDDIENFVSQKVQKPGTFDISGVLAKYLSMPSFKCVAVTTYEGLHAAVEGNASFANLFEKVEVAEVSEEETINILQSVALELEYTYKLLVLYPAIREIVNLTARYMPSLPFPKKALDVLKEAVIYVQRLKEKVVLPHHITEIISKKTEIPMGKMAVQEKETLLNLENLIHGRIVGQDEVVSEISTAMRRARMGIASKTRPMGTFLFLGPTGVGKTETAKALAQIYFGSESKMITLDMSEFQTVTDIPRLLGATSPVEMQGLLTTPVRENPFSLVLLDEIEKAHPNILNLFLQVLDEGHVTDGQGRKVIFTNTIIICTSNAGADMIFKSTESNQAINKDTLLDSLFEKNIFRPEFVNRFDAAIIFHPLTKADLMKIAKLSLQSLQKNLKEKDIIFEITESLQEKIVELSYKPSYGAREMRRVIQDKVESLVADALLSDKIKKGDRIQINAENFEIIVNPAQS